MWAACKEKGIDVRRDLLIQHPEKSSCCWGPSEALKCGRQQSSIHPGSAVCVPRDDDARQSAAPEKKKKSGVLLHPAPCPVLSLTEA